MKKSIVFLLLFFTAIDCWSYAVPAYDPVIAADDYYQLRPSLKVIEGGKINTSKPVLLADTAGSLGLAGLVSGSSGIAGLAYYQRTGKDPVYALANSIAYATDQIFVPAYQAFKADFVSPESFPAAAAQYVGIEGSIGAAVGDFVKYVTGSSDPALDDLRQTIASHTVTGGLNGSSLPLNVAGQVVTSNTGQNVQFGGTTWNTGMDPNYITSQMATKSPRFSFSTGGGCWSTTGSVNGEWQCGNYGSWEGTWLAKIWAFNGSATANPATFVPSPDSIDYPGLHADLAPWIIGHPDLTHQVIADMPRNEIGVTSNPSPQAVPEQVQPAINQQQVQNFYNQNASNVANYNTTNITNNSTIQDIAKGQAATTAAQQTARQSEPDYPKNVTVTGDSSLPAANLYDSTVQQPVEINYIDKVHQFINSGLPVLSSIKNSHLTASGSPRMATSIWGHTVDIDFSDQQSVLRTAGAVLVTISLILSYLVIVRS